jgi:Gpi18-like mannosyltransferase
MVKSYSFFADPHNFNTFWLNTNLLFLFISKLPAIIADFGVAAVFIYIGRNAKKLGFPSLPITFYSLLAVIYLLNPISIIDGAWWGQLDSLGVLLFLISLLLLLRRMPFLAGVVYMIAMMTKLQNMIYGPVFFLLVLQLTGLSGLIRAVAGALLTFAGTNIEFILARNFGRVIESVTGNYDYFPWLSLNAFNPWWIWSGAHGMKGSDKVLAIGLASAKNVGLYVFSAGYLFAVLHQWFAKQSKLQTFLETFMIVNGSFFLFQTESHDRYAFPFIILILLWAPFVINKLNLRIFFIFYFLFSLLYFYNLHTALIWNYPQNGIPFLTGLTPPWLTIGISFIFTGSFLWFILWLARDKFWTLIPPISLIALMLLAKNHPLITKSPVYVGSLTPTDYKQDYGGRMVDMPTNASLGIKNWSSLSVQYAFYRRGIGTHANSYQIFDIGGLFNKFSFDYGVDTEAGPKGSVTFEVYGDGKKLFASKKIGRFDLPRHADVSVAGVHTLKLVVTDAGDGITDDHADWLNPKLYE